jgi:hypothetical protein
MSDEFDGIGGQIAVYCAPTQDAHRNEAEQEDQNLEPFAREEFAHGADD